MELVKIALGGILFIDEAYSLARGGTKDFGKMPSIACQDEFVSLYKNELLSFEEKTGLSDIYRKYGFSPVYIKSVLKDKGLETN